MPLKIPPSLMPNKPAAKLTSNKPLIKFKILSLLLSLPILINSKINISKLNKSSCLSNIKMLDDIMLNYLRVMALSMLIIKKSVEGIIN